MLKRDLISIIMLCLVVIGSIVEFFLTHKPPYIFNLWLLPATVITIIFDKISKPFKNWLNSPIKEELPEEIDKYNFKEIKTKLIDFLNEFGWSNKRNKHAKLLYWVDKDLWLVLWLKRFVMYTDQYKHKGQMKLKGIIDGIANNIFTIEELKQFMKEFKSSK